MDEVLGEAHLEAAEVGEGVNHNGKENEFSLKLSESSSILESREMVVHQEANFADSSFHVLVEMLEGKDLKWRECPMDDKVEELMARTDANSHTTIVGSSKHMEKVSRKADVSGTLALSDPSQPLKTALPFSFGSMACWKANNSGTAAVPDHSPPLKFMSRSSFGCMDSRKTDMSIIAAVSDPSLPLQLRTTSAPSFGSIGIEPPSCLCNEGVSLREWLDTRQHKVNKAECLRIFREIVDLVLTSHTKGVAFVDLRPSCFKLMHSNQFRYIGSAIPSDMVKKVFDKGKRSMETCVTRRTINQINFPSIGSFVKRQKLVDKPNYVQQWPQFKTNYGIKLEERKKGDNNEASIQINEHEERTKGDVSGCQVFDADEQLSSVSDQYEKMWYSSPEELREGTLNILSNIYSLGVLFFELLGRFNSKRERLTAMSDVFERILPPRFLGENTKEVGFCLWLLHPKPSSRPTAREILQFDVINGFQEMCAQELSVSIQQDDAESELVLHFLTSVSDNKLTHASKLEEDICWLEADIEDFKKRNISKKSSAFSSPGAFCSSGEWLTRSIDQLKSAYFSMRSRIQSGETHAPARQDDDLLTSHEIWYSTLGSNGQHTRDNCLGTFFNGLCKYAHYSEFQVRGLVRNRDFISSSNTICSLSFNRDGNYFAAAGMSKKIKIYEYHALLNNFLDIVYPAVEMPDESEISCVCWNNYINNYLASSGFDGAVKARDVNTGQGVIEFSGHEKKAWSVDFSTVHPTKLVSGSDHCVKLWSISEKQSIGTIWNDSNVCCVQFSPHSTHLLAFGSSNFKIYCYDLRNSKLPWCVLAGHNKAVSYVKFLDPGTLVTASIDNTLKLWDLHETSSIGFSTSACNLTLSGHTNNKNFVGLSLLDGYIFCGSETNEVYAYYRSQPMPITSHKFGSIDPITGRDTDDRNGEFVSSVCCRGNSPDTLIAANSTGCIKVLQLV